MGGFETTSLEVFNTQNACLGNVATPSLPSAPVTPRRHHGWSAEYIEGRIWLCGGVETAYSAVCSSVAFGENNWRDVSESSNAMSTAWTVANLSLIHI